MLTESKFKTFYKEIELFEKEEERILEVEEIVEKEKSYKKHTRI